MDTTTTVKYAIEHRDTDKAPWVRLDGTFVKPPTRKSPVVVKLIHDNHAKHLRVVEIREAVRPL